MLDVMVKNPEEGGSRRTFIATTTAGLMGIAGLPALGSAKKSPDEIMAKAREKRASGDWSSQQYRKYLRKKGFSTPHVEKTVTRRVRSNEEDDYSTQNFRQSKFHMDMTLGYNEDYAYPFCSFTVEDGWGRDGEYPDDGLSFGWDSHEYDYAGDDNSGWWSGGDAELAQYSGRGIAYHFPDSGNAKDDDNWVQAKLQKSGGTANTRNVIFSYMHTYNATRLESVSVNTDGVVTVTLANQTYKWNDPAQTQVFEGKQ